MNSEVLHNGSHATLGLRLQAAMCFLTSSLALAVVSLFALAEAIRPWLHGEPQDAAVIQNMLAEMYPFEWVNEARLIYGGVLLLPVLIPVLFRGRWAAWLTLVLSVLLTLVNLEDALLTFVLGGMPLFGSAFMAIVGVPALLGMSFVWRWLRATRRSPGPVAGTTCV